MLWTHPRVSESIGLGKFWTFGIGILKKSSYVINLQPGLRIAGVNNQLDFPP